MRNKQIAKVEITNWRKYQTRTDLKTMSFFRVQGTIFHDAKFSSLNPSEKLVWFVLLASCCQSNSSEVEVNVKLASSQVPMKPKLFLQTLSTLEEFQMLRLISVTDSCPRKTRLERQDKTRLDKTMSTRTNSSSTPPRKDPPKIHWLVELWNTESGKLPKVRVPISKKRAKQIQQAVKEVPDKNLWAEGLAKLNASDFCNGKNQNGWNATFDWFVKPENLNKTLEGKYCNRQGRKLHLTRANQVEENLQTLWDEVNNNGVDEREAKVVNVSHETEKSDSETTWPTNNETSNLQT